jgi:hypothetical protein
MHDPSSVGLVEGVCNVNRELQRLGKRQRAPRQSVRQGLAFQVLHDEERRAVLLTHVVQRADVRMIEMRDRASFAVEPLAELLVGR